MWGPPVTLGARREPPLMATFIRHALVVATAAALLAFYVLVYNGLGNT